MIFEEKRWNWRGTEKGVLTSGPLKSVQRQFEKHRQPKCITWISFSICFFWSPWKIFHTEKIGLKPDPGGDFPYIFPKASLFSSQTESLQFPQLPPKTPWLPPKTEAFWTWKLDRQILKGRAVGCRGRVGVFRGKPPFLGKPRKPQNREKRWRKGNEKSQET